MVRRQMKARWRAPNNSLMLTRRAGLQVQLAPHAGLAENPAWLGRFRRAA